MALKIHTYTYIKKRTKIKNSTFKKMVKYCKNPNEAKL